MYMKNSPIGIFDSGSGGITVLQACRKILPDEKYIYVSDSRSGGWGGLNEDNIAKRVKMCVDKLVSRGCKAVVAACNTATEVSIGSLRHEYDVPFIGLEPALKPAVKAFGGGKILVLCTPATARQIKFRNLLESCKDANVTVKPQAELAKNIERNLDDLSVLREYVDKLILSEKPDAVVLGCTHYVFIRYMFEALLGADAVFDGNCGAANRLKAILLENNLLNEEKTAAPVEFCKI